MSIQFTLLSVASTAFLLLFCVVGSEVIMHDLSIDFSFSGERFYLDINPVWIVWADERHVYNYGRGCNAFAYGNVIVVGEHIRGGACEDHILAHESMHVKQFRALGWWIYLAQFVLPIEPPGHITINWNDPTQPERTMWKQPDWWFWKWSFVTIRFDTS